ncbi:MAG: ABC transporter permease [Candidatus Hodarchaeota archaeon]
MSGIRNYIITRVLLLIPIMIISLCAVFLIMRVFPGDPVYTVLGEGAPLEVVEDMREMLGLNVPLHQQFINYWVDLLHGDLGRSIHSGKPVLSEILYRFPVTLQLTIGSILISTTIGLLFGVKAAEKRGKIDAVFVVYAALVYSIPYFLLGVLLQYFFSVFLGILPVYGLKSALLMERRVTGFILLDSLINFDLRLFFDSMKHFILPWLTMGVAQSAPVLRLLRTNLNQVLAEEYITTARAKGLKKNSIFYKHALKNALLPVITLITMQFAKALGGAIITETIFALPGVGRLFVNSILNRDYALVQGCAIFLIVVVSVILLVMDVLYAYIDPRIHY